MLNCSCELLIGRTFLGEFPESVLSQSPELLGKSRLAVEVNLKEIPAVRFFAGVSNCRGTVGTALILTESVGVNLVENIADSVGKCLILYGERTVVAIDLKYGGKRSLHLLVEDINDLALDELWLYISPLGSLLALWKRAYIFLHQRFESVNIDITDNHHHRTGGISEEFPVVLLDGLKVSLLKFLHRKHLVSWVVVIEDLVEPLLESEVRSVHEVREHGLDLGHSLVIFLLIKPWIHKLKVEQLESGLKILDGRVAGNSIVEVIHKRPYAYHLSGKHLVQFRGLELGQALSTLKDFVDCAVK